MALRRQHLDDKTTQAVMKQLAEAVSGWQRYPCKVVTPMYGGGVSPGEVDQEMPIRASAVRGQLRFWWRITGGPFESAREMFERETAIWGGLGEKEPMASKVDVTVTNAALAAIEAAHTYQPNLDPDKRGQFKASPSVASWADAYSLFPAQGKLSGDKRTIECLPKQLAKPGVTFELALRLDDKLNEVQRKEVLSAMRWWASFGGIGARSRRGVGAVHVENLDAVSAAEVMAKRGVLKTLAAEPGPTAAWKKATGRLRDFRQRLDLGRNPPAPPSDSPAGRSLWPEADALRALSGCAHPKHRPRLVMSDVFARSAFGLPIVFHFKDAPKEEHKRARSFSASNFDPEDHILEPVDLSPTAKRDRMASPLILRPYWNGQTWQPAALLIPGWEAALTQELKFKGQTYKPRRWPDAAADRLTEVAAISPMKNAAGKPRAGDPLSAFMDFFERGV